MKMLHMIAFTLLVVGGLNWGLWALFNMNLVSTIFASWPSVEKIVYVLIGASAVYIAATHVADCKTCSGKSN